MAQKTIGILFALIFCAPVLLHAADYQMDPAQSKIKFSVRATVYTINGKAQQSTGKVTFDLASKTVSLPLSIEIPVKFLKTRNKLRDRDMRKMFEAEKYPVILWTASKVDCGPGSALEFLTCQTSGTLRIRDVEKGVTFPVELTLSEKAIRADGLVRIQRDDFGLKTPSMLGLIRVAQEVIVQFKTEWIQRS